VVSRLGYDAPALAAFARLLDAPSLEETLVGGVLPDVGGVTLFRGVDLRVRRARVLRPVGGTGGM
jgi:hypothetical protein